MTIIIKIWINYKHLLPMFRYGPQIMGVSRWIDFGMGSGGHRRIKMETREKSTWGALIGSPGTKTLPQDQRQEDEETLSCFVNH
jgi:hypothetical protein